MPLDQGSIRLKGPGVDKESTNRDPMIRQAITRGRVLCIVPSTDFISLFEILAFLGLSARLLNLVIWYRNRTLHGRDDGIKVWVYKRTQSTTFLNVNEEVKPALTRNGTPENWLV